MRLLVIEDDPKIASALKKGLEQERFAVDIATDGNTGLATALVDEYDAIILDIMLPTIDGLTVCKTLRQKKNTTPILMLTAKDTIQDRVTGLDDGADDYLIKPFSFDELIARVRALIRRPRAASGPVLTFDDLSLNPTSFEVKRGKKTLKLSSKEFSLLEYLLRNANKVLSKDQIIRHVWDFDADILPNTVEVYIGYLRSKIDKPFKTAKPLIQTVRGFGYKLGL